mgnify:CR=1 FL=1
MTRRARLRPIWLRPTTIVVVAGLHLAGVAVARGVAVPVVPSTAPILEIEQAPEPVATPVETAAAEPRPPEPPPPPEPEPPPPPPEPEPAPPEPPPPEAVEPPPEPEPVVEKIEPKPEPRPVEKKRPKKPVERKAVERPRLSAPTLEATNAAAASASDRRAAAASYAARVASEFARHKRYPDAARAARIEGTAVLAFVIGPSGSLVSHSIVRSSGDARLDAAVHAMAAASRFPPPPEGRFASSIPVRFTIRR